MSPHGPHRSSALPDANHDIAGSSETVDTQLDVWAVDVPREDDMDTRLVNWSPTSPDVNQHITDSSMKTQIDIHQPSVPSVSNLSSSFSTECSISEPRAIIDPFGSLPWFGLEEVLFNLPDLSTLHQLCQASPAVSDYLSDKTGIFPKVVERIMDPCIEPQTGSSIREPDRGFFSDTSAFFRTLVYLWWKEDSVATGMPADENPLPDAFDDKRLYCVNISVAEFPEPPHVGLIPLPSSTPPKILRHLLSLASRIRGDAHAFFHAAMAHFKSAKIEELPSKSSFGNKIQWEEDGIRRPRGIPLDISGADWPLTWLEEQRLIHALLKPYIFSVLRRMVCEEKVLTTNATPSSLEIPREATLQDLEKDAVVGFWGPLKDTDMGQMTLREDASLEQLETILTWKEWQRRTYGKLGKREAKFTTCCPKFTRSYNGQLASLRTLQDESLLGPFFAQKCFHTVVRDAGLRGDFHKFGVSFWDSNRMMDLELVTKEMNRAGPKRDLALRWLTLLLSTSRRRKYGQKRPNRFRSHTEAITVAK